MQLVLRDTPRLIVLVANDTSFEVVPSGAWGAGRLTIA
jgi:hypothetical protein